MARAVKHGCCSRLWLYMGQSVHGGSAIHPEAARGGRRACSRVADHGKRLEESPGLGFQSSRVEGLGCKCCRQTLWHLTRAGRLPGAKHPPHVPFYSLLPRMPFHGFTFPLARRNARTQRSSFAQLARPTLIFYAVLSPATVSLLFNLWSPALLSYPLSG